MKSKKLMLYSNAVKTNIELKIKKIPILEWLKHYGLEDFYHTIFVEKHNIIAYPSGIKYPYEYSHLLTNIKTNIDLLFSFNNSFKFKEAISVPCGRKLHEMNQSGLITQDEVQDGEIEYRFFKAFELLQKQKIDYKAMLSIFSLKPNKAKYDLLLEDNLDFLDHTKYKSKNIFKNEILAKLKLISFNDLLQCKQTTFNLLLSLPIEEIKKYILYTTNKVVKITNGLKSSFTKKQFNKFIDDNESLKVFESCYNNYDLNYVNKSFKNNFDAKSLLSINRMDLLEYIFNPNNLIDSEISEKIYNTFFPDNDHIYIDQQFSKIGKNIPKTIVSDNFMKKTNIRVFCIQGHGMSCTIEDYKKKNRVDFEKVFTKINEEQKKYSIQRKYSIKRKTPIKGFRYNANMLNNISTQQVGRKSFFKFIQLFNKIFSSKYRNIFLQGIINSTKIEHLRLLENIVNMYWNHYCIKNINDSQHEGLSTYLKKSRLNHYKDYKYINPINFPNNPGTTSDVINFVKYGYKYPPINTQFYFESMTVNDGMMGIFELNEENASDFIKLDNKISSLRTNDDNIKLGLKLNDIYEFRGDIPRDSDNILKYNRALNKKYTKMYTLEEIMVLIYLHGDIKPNEYVVIFDNSCRGLKENIRIQRELPLKSINTREIMGTTSAKHKLNILRATSIEDSLEQFKKVGLRKSKKNKL
jgi:hypothetical protein